MPEESVIEEQRARVAAYAERLADMASVGQFGQHGFIAAAVSALARVRAADYIDGTRSVDDVAGLAGVDASALRRILRFIEPHGFVDLSSGSPALTPTGELLRSDGPLWPGLNLRGANDAAWHLDHSLRTGEAAFPQEFHTDFWSYLAAHPDQQEAFADSLRLHAAMLSVACLPRMDLAGIGIVADIGGGTGDLLAAVLEAHPELKGILVDRPEMLEKAHPTLREGPLASRCTLLVGDLFAQAPAADAYILAGVLHDWGDSDAARILGGVRRGASAGSRLFVLTSIIPEGPEAHPSKTGDIGMMVLFGQGRERTEPELRELLSAAGWAIESVVATRVASVITASAVSQTPAAQQALPADGGKLGQ